MALVVYSDSETSDVEDVAAPKPSSSIATATASIGKAGFRTTDARKIKVDLPALRPEVQDAEPERPAKRARVGGGDFNSFLPAPKRTAEQGKSGIGRGVSLKTSSEAAFSREAPEPREQGENGGFEEDSGDGKVQNGQAGNTSKVNEVTEAKTVGKATKFKPLSVQAGNKKKAKKPVATISTPNGSGNIHVGAGKDASTSMKDPEVRESIVAPPPPKPKQSLFSVPQAEEQPDYAATTIPTVYEAITTQSHTDNDYIQPSQMPQDAHSSHPTAHTTYQPDITAGLDLTPAQRRQIFGRNGKASEVNIAHFNMDAEYASNEALRQSGETVEHRAVKSIAPGKHSLQQLVNNAKSQQDNLEDKWAEGQRKRGEGSSRYGWGR